MFCKGQELQPCTFSYTVTFKRAAALILPALFARPSFPKSLRQECRLSRTMSLVMLSGLTELQINMVSSIITAQEQHLILLLSFMHTAFSASRSVSGDWVHLLIKHCQ